MTFAGHPLPTVDVSKVLDAQLRNMVADLCAVADRPTSEVAVFKGNSKELSRVVPRSHQQATAVITSPPYPNRFSYARETRPHLFFFDFIESAAAVGQLETDAIGGKFHPRILDYAREHSAREIVELLEKAGAKGSDRRK